MDGVTRQDRIGVLEELLNERYSVRAFLPKRCRARPSTMCS